MKLPLVFLGILCLLLISVGLIGCDSDSSKSNTVTGIVTEVVPIQLPDAKTGILVHFEDGRITRLYLPSYQVYTFRKGKSNAITYDAFGGVEKIEIKE